MPVDDDRVWTLGRRPIEPVVEVAVGSGEDPVDDLTHFGTRRSGGAHRLTELASLLGRHRVHRRQAHFGDRPKQHLDVGLHFADPSVVAAPASVRGGTGEAEPVLLDDLVADGAVVADATDVGQEHPRLAGNVRSRVPRVGLGEERDVATVGGVRLPARLGLLGRLEHHGSLIAHRDDRVGDPLDVLFDRHGHVRQDRRALRTGHHEVVGEADRREPEIGGGTVGPLVLEFDALAAADVDVDDRAGHRVEAGREHDRIELARPAPVLDARIGDGDERVSAQVDQFDAVEVERLVVVRIEAHALREDRVGRRTERLGHLGVVDDRTDLVAHELTRPLVGDRVHDQVGDAGAEPEQAFGIRGLERRVALVVTQHRPGLGGLGQRNTGAGPTGLFSVGLVAAHHLVDPLGGERTVAGRQREVRRPLVHRHRRGLLRDQRDRLDARRAGTDHGDPLAGEVDALVGPASGHVGVTAEPFDAGDVDFLGHREATGRHDVPLGVVDVTVLGRDRPPARSVVPRRAGHPGLEADVAAQVVAIGDVLQVTQDLALGRVALAPLPLLLELGVEAVAVVETLDVAACPRVPVPVPRAADVVGRLEGDCVDAELSAAVDQVQAGHAGSDDHGINGLGLGHGLRFTQGRGGAQSVPWTGRCRTKFDAVSFRRGSSGC